MNKYILGAVFSLGLFLSPVYTEAASLTSIQVNAILTLLSSFGADQSVIDNVHTSLEKSNSPAQPTKPVNSPTVKTLSPNTAVKATGTYTDWYFSSNASSFDNLGWDVTVNSDPSPQSYFYATQFWFLKNNNASGGGYFGIQTQGSNPTGKIAIFSIWDALDARGPGYAGTFSGEGVGRSVRFSYPWIANRVYHLRIVKQATETDGQWWGAYIKDTTTQSESYVGEIKVPLDSTKLYTIPTSWTEYYGTNPSTCDGFNLSKVSFTNVTANNGLFASNGHNNHLGNPVYCAGSSVSDVLNGTQQKMGTHTAPVVAAPDFVLSRVTNSDQSQTIYWTTTNTNSLKFRCIGSHGDVKTGDNLPLQQVPVTNSWKFLTDNGWKGAYTCTYTATGSGGVKDFHDSFDIKEVQVPTVSLTVNNAHNVTISSGETKSAVWTSSGATTWSSRYLITGSCANAGASGSWVATTQEGSSVLHWNERNSGCTTAITYTSGNVTDTLYVTTVPTVPTSVVIPLPTFSNTRITNADQSQTISWTTTNATSLSFHCDSNQTKEVAIPLQQATTTTSWSDLIKYGWVGSYACTYTAIGPGGTTVYREPSFTISPVTVNTNQAVPVPTISVYRNPSSATVGTNYTVSWNSTNATSVSWSCTGPFTGTGSFPDASGNGVTGVVSGPFGNWIGTTNCVWTATGPGGSVSTTESFTVTSPVTMNTGKKENQMASALSAFTSAAHANRAQESIENFQYAWDTNLQIGSPYTSDVTALQTVLTREGVYTGEITGGFYDQTYGAVKRFQEKYGIESTGFVGPDTRSKLNSLY